MKIIFSERENQHLEATPATFGPRLAPGSRPPRQTMSSQVGHQTLTNPRVRGNLLIKYENMILLTEEGTCVCPRCRRTSGTTLLGTRYRACCLGSGGILK